MFHLTAFTEHQHDPDTAYPKEPVHARDVDLASHIAGELHPDAGPEIHAHRFADECEATGDQSLACDDGRQGRYAYTGDQEPIGHQCIERIAAIERTS